jgi:hypothetical protein
MTLTPSFASSSLPMKYHFKLWDACPKRVDFDDIHRGDAGALRDIAPSAATFGTCRPAFLLTIPVIALRWAAGFQGARFRPRIPSGPLMRCVPLLAVAYASPRPVASGCSSECASQFAAYHKHWNSRQTRLGARNPSVHTVNGTFFRQSARGTTE